jgi:DNA-binding NarL/FixJ family response regulator
MAKNTKTHIFCYDDHRGFAEDVRKRFSDETRYTVVSFQTREDFIDHLEAAKEHNYCKVAILGLHDTQEQFEMIDHLTKEIKEIDSHTGLILLGPPDKMEAIKKTVKFNVDAFIPKNTNSILRIHNAVKKLISEHGIGIFRKRSNISVYVLLGFILASVILLIVAYFRLPQYF